jgi:pimeloyl-ACP methyl ester carboxylesterase
MFDNWADELKGARPEVPESAWESFKHNMYDGDFLFNVDREFVRRCTTPLLVLCGNDAYHPKSVSEDVAELAPNARFVAQWKEGADRDDARAAVRAFLDANTPR